MKELSVEEKAKRYDIALDKIKMLLGTGSSCSREELEYVFPELAESEDEMIRKELITHCKNIRCVTEEGAEGIAKWIAWLEKQGEHAKFRDSIQIGDKVTRNEDGVLVNLSQLKRVAKPAEVQGEQKPAVIFPKFRVGDEIKTANEESLIITKIDEKGYWSEDLFICCFEDADKWKLVEQKSALSEEDEARFKSCIKILQTSDGYDTINTKWLKSLKDRIQPQPKQEWSEEEEKNFNHAIKVLKVTNFHNVANMLQEMKYKLTPREETNNWKPSDEQLKSLEEVIDTGYFTSYPFALETLFKDLKKLKE